MCTILIAAMAVPTGASPLLPGVNPGDDLHAPPLTPDMLSPIEYDHRILSPEEAEIMKDIDGRFVCKMIADHWTVCAAADWPIEAMANELDTLYVFIDSTGELKYYSIYNGSPVIQYENLDDEFLSFYFFDTDLILKAFHRDDIFSQASITRDLDDIEVHQVFALYRFYLYTAVAVYYKTNYGDYIHYVTKNKGDYLFEADEFYEYYNRNQSWNLDDPVFEKNKVSLATNELPYPTLSDPSVIFAATALISLGGFAAFAVKRPRRKETEN